jgi:hypothetical protein
MVLGVIHLVLLGNTRCLTSWQEMSYSAVWFVKHDARNASNLCLFLKKLEDKEVQAKGYHL